VAVSTGRCNTGLEFTSRSFKAQGFAWALIVAQGDFVQVGLGVAGQGGFPGEVLPQQAVGIFVGAALPRALRITEVDVYLGGHGEAFWPSPVLGPRSRTVAATRGVYEPAGSAHRRRLPCLYFDQHGKTRMSFHQGCDVTVAGAAEQISLLMPGDGTVFNLCRPCADGDGIDDLTAGLSASTSVHGATDRSLGPQVLHPSEDPVAYGLLRAEKIVPTVQGNRGEIKT
jgi:hypothetical protein